MYASRTTTRSGTGPPARRSPRVEARRRGLRLAAAVPLLSPLHALAVHGRGNADTVPFSFFVDHSDPELLRKVREGRAAEIRGIGLD